MNSNLLILDLDETLIHSIETKLDVEPDFYFEPYYVYKRPYLSHFLNEIKEHFKIAIWSSADDNYVSHIADQIKPESLNYEFVWGRSRCSPKRDSFMDRYIYEKRLYKIKSKKYNLEKTIIVDDTPEKVRVNYGNAVYIKEFKGESTDEELTYLLPYLISLKNVTNIRNIEKRGWRSLV